MALKTIPFLLNEYFVLMTRQLALKGTNRTLSKKTVRGTPFNPSQTSL